MLSSDSRFRKEVVPRGSGVDEAAFYSYAYPEPEGFRTAAVQPSNTIYEPKLGLFMLPYTAVKSAPDPEATLLEFLRSTYEAAANLAGWNRAELECAFGEPRVPRQI
jgi:hypothetical protein